ncbi:hypothetical protein GQ457_05G020480 [Hibiscus cannabinus]
MVRPRRSVRGGGQAPVHLDEVEIEDGNEETLPPLPPVGGEANEGAQIFAFLVSSIGTDMVVSVLNSSLESVYRCSHIGTGFGIGTLFRVSVPFDTGIGTTRLSTDTGSLEQFLESLEA